MEKDMYKGVKVTHEKWGEGQIVSLTDTHIIVSFTEKEIKFQFPSAIGKYLHVTDEALKQYAAECALKEKKEEKEKNILKEKKEAGYSYSGEGNYSSPLLGRRAQDIVFSRKEDFYEVLGYLAKPGRIVFFQAELPSDKTDAFEKLFPGQDYSTIAESYGKGGLITKQGCQFRINLSNVDNCPSLLKPHISEKEGHYVGRINRSKFALRLVQNNGFRFGRSQDVNEIRSKVPSKYINSFERGLNL